MLLPTPPVQPAINFIRAEHSRAGAVHLMAQQYARGRLCFGATRGPPSWVEEHDGPWSAGYWIEVVGGADDGLTIPVPLDGIARSLREGDMCEVVEDTQSGAIQCNALSVHEADAPAESFRFEQKKRNDRWLQLALRPAAIGLVIFAAAFLFAQNAPTPTASESLERCERLMIGIVGTGDRPAAERWLATCSDVPREDAERLLDDQWRRRWGDVMPARFVQGVPEAL